MISLQAGRGGVTWHSFGVILSHKQYLQLPPLRSPMMEIPEVLETGGLKLESH